MSPTFTRTTVIVAAVVCLTPWISPPVALAIGLAIGLTLGNPWPKETAKATKLLLQASVVGLGFGMNMEAVIRAGTEGIGFTMATIAGTLLLGAILGRSLSISPRTTHLISSGTAICGGSAIAAVGPVMGASDEEMSVSLGTVFILNAIALFAFPPIGVALGLTQSQFGIWSAVAIHDTSSVVGAASKFGAEALQIATTVKLTRALWIIPLALATAFAVHRRAAKVTVPWFIVFFFVAAAVRTWAGNPFDVFAHIVFGARRGLTLTLFLIGANLTLPKLKAVGARPLILGVALWIAISLATLAAVRTLV
ncbi:MAG: putative sulfate exporter family transporter [Acidobacteria bacterium]|nr:putative sulfate exporter family transporter [Acidobacteriota bacterium]